MTIREKLVSDFSAAPEYRKDLASSHHSLGQLMRKLNRPKEAEESYRAAQSILRELTEQFPL